MKYSLALLLNFIGITVMKIDKLCLKMFVCKKILKNMYIEIMFDARKTNYNYVPGFTQNYESMLG